MRILSVYQIETDHMMVDTIIHIFKEKNMQKINYYNIVHYVFLCKYHENLLHDKEKYTIPKFTDINTEVLKAK